MVKLKPQALTRGPSKAAQSHSTSQAFEQCRRQVALGRGWQHDDDVLFGHARALAYLQGGCDRGPRRDAAQYSLMPRQCSGGVECHLVGDCDHLVNHRTVENVRNEAGANTLNSMRARLAARQHGTVFRLHGDNPQGPLPWLENLADARDGAASADTGHKHVYFAAGVVPNLLGVGSPVDLRAFPILELLRH